MNNEKNTPTACQRIAIFASGSGTNAEAIVRYFQGRDDVQVARVVSDRSDAYVHQRMKPLQIPTCTFPREEWRQGSQVLALMQQEQIRLIILAGFLAYVPQALLQAFPGRILNIHPSLLPKFGGKGMWGMHVHRAVLAAGEKESGITVHRVTEQVDGGEILFQASCPVMPDDTPETLAARVHQLEYTHFAAVIDRELSLQKQSTAL